MYVRPVRFDFFIYGFLNELSGNLMVLDQYCNSSFTFISAYKCTWIRKRSLGTLNSFNHRMKNKITEGSVFEIVVDATLVLPPSPQYRKRPAMKSSRLFNKPISFFAVSRTFAHLASRVLRQVSRYFSTRTALKPCNSPNLFSDKGIFCSHKLKELLLTLTFFLI